MVAKLNGDAAEAIIDDPVTKEKLKRVGFEGFSSSSDEFGAYIKVQLDTWRKMVAESGVQSQ